MKLLRRAASSRRRASDGLGSACLGGGATRWRTTRVTSTPPRVVTVTDDGCARATLLGYLRSRQGCAMTLGTTATLVVVIVIVLLLTLKASGASPAGTSALKAFSATPADTSTSAFTEPPDLNSTLPGSFRVISKREWGGRPEGPHPVSTPPFPLHHPIPYVVISATVGPTCFDVNECSRTCRLIQNNQMRQHYDISCNFLVGGDGNVYEGRGWDRTNYHSGFNGLLDSRNVDVCFIGDFTKDEPTDRQLIAAKELLISGISLGKLATDYKMFSLNDTDMLEEPAGEYLYSHIKHWRYFTLRSAVCKSIDCNGYFPIGDELK